MNDFQPLTVQQANQFLIDKLATDSPEDDARYLLSFILEKSFTWLKTWPDESLSQDQMDALHQVLSRRLSGEPIAYITGEKDFWTLSLKTNSSTLIPRPETELLVESALEFLQADRSTDSNSLATAAKLDSAESVESKKILDLGTGTGAIGLAIASERPHDKVTAVDYQPEAVELARKNAEWNEIENIQIFRSNWFEAITENRFDLIVSNPPYIEKNDPHLQQGDLVFEPQSALVADEDGLSDIKEIINSSPDFLIDGGMVMLEHGFQQAEAVASLMKLRGFNQVRSLSDLAGHLRVTMGVFNQVLNKPEDVCAHR